MQINSDLLHELFGKEFPQFCVEGIGVTTSSHKPSIITYLASPKYVNDINKNTNIKAAFIKQEMAGTLRPDIISLKVENPLESFSKLINHLGKNKNRETTKIDATANIHPSSIISKEGVIIGKNSIIEPNVTIYSDVEIGDNVLIRAGAVIGFDGFEHKKINDEVVSIIHDGKVIIKDFVEIGANNTIAKGFSYRDTIIGKYTKLDALVHYAHGVQCGEKCLIASSVVIAGHVNIGDEVWIGPSSSIVNRISIKSNAFITLGSVVVRNVEEGEKVTGNFAISHNKFIRNLKKSLT